MLEDDLARLVDGFRVEVLDLLTRLINDAFEQALSTSDLAKDAEEPTLARKQQLPGRRKQRRSRRSKAAQIAAGQELQVRSSENKSEASTASVNTPQPRSRRSTKGPSRNEIDRLVQAGLASRLGGENPSVTSATSL